MSWKPATYDCATTEGKIAVHGISNGTFGVDERPNLLNARRKAWAIIHIQTGYAAAFVQGPIANAKRFADDLTAVADWGFADSETARSRSKAVRPVFERHSANRIGSGEVGVLKRAFTYPEEVK